MAIIKSVECFGWKRALNAARRTCGKSPIDKEPSENWKAKMLLSEHSPIRLVEFDIIIENIKQWITVHLVRHKFGVEHFVHSQRDDRRQLDVPRDKLPQGSPNDMQISANAQAMMAISRERLCHRAHPETRQVWEQVRDAVRTIEPVLADKMVPKCVHKGFCSEEKCCGFIKSARFKILRSKYLKTDYANSEDHSEKSSGEI